MRDVSDPMSFSRAGLEAAGRASVCMAGMALRHQKHGAIRKRAYRTWCSRSTACRRSLWLDLPAMHPLIEIHGAELLALARRRSATGVRVFGSMSSRDDGGDDSDIDLLVTLAPGTSALALGGLLMDAQDLLGRHVDVVTEASLHPALRERVMASAVPL